MLSFQGRLQKYNLRETTAFSIALHYAFWNKISLLERNFTFTLKKLPLNIKKIRSAALCLSSTSCSTCADTPKAHQRKVKLGPILPTLHYCFITMVPFFRFPFPASFLFFLSITFLHSLSTFILSKYLGFGAESLLRPFTVNPMTQKDQ